MTVTVRDDANAVSETLTLTHTATIGDDEDSVVLSRASVRVTAKDTDTRGVTISETTTPEEVPEAGSAIYTVVLDTEPTDMVTVDVGGVSGELAVSPSRLFFMPGADGNWDDAADGDRLCGRGSRCGGRHRNPQAYRAGRRLYRRGGGYRVGDGR